MEHIDAEEGGERAGRVAAPCAGPAGIRQIDALRRPQVDEPRVPTPAVDAGEMRRVEIARPPGELPARAGRNRRRAGRFRCRPPAHRRARSRGTRRSRPRWLGGCGERPAHRAGLPPASCRGCRNRRRIEAWLRTHSWPATTPHEAMPCRCGQKRIRRRSADFEGPFVVFTGRMGENPTQGGEKAENKDPGRIFAECANSSPCWRRSAPQR